MGASRPTLNSEKKQLVSLASGASRYSRTAGAGSIYIYVCMYVSDDAPRLPARYTQALPLPIRSIQLVVVVCVFPQAAHTMCKLYISPCAAVHFSVYRIYIQSVADV